VRTLSLSVLNFEGAWLSPSHSGNIEQRVYE
jgi:hypothetical protein